MTGRALFILILFFGWCGFSTWYYNCKIKGLCNVQEIRIQTPDEEAQDIDNLTEESLLDSLVSEEINKEGIFFSWNSDSAQSHQIKNFLNSKVLVDVSEDDKLLITGKYFVSEENKTEKENLGFSRAENAKQIISKFFNAEKIELSSEITNSDSSITDLMELLSFQKIQPKKEKEIAIREGKVLVYFNSNSDNPQLGKGVQDYLNKIGDELLADKYKNISASGFTDNIGNTKNNYYMGLHRAQAVQNYLVSLGCNPNQIELKSYGEYRPVAENDTDEGRAKNRRVEIKLNY